MNSNAPFTFVLALGLVLASTSIAAAQRHRATHLGNPQTRFAEPLTRPGDLRARFRDEKLKLDIAEVLVQWGWKGNVEDFHYAVLTAEITEVQLPHGTRMPFMSSRKNGKPVCLIDVIWEGQHPAPAYVFTFSSNGRKYRCVTPKACSNFYLEDLGPEPSKLELEKILPAETSICEPLEGKLIVRNTGRVTLNQIRVIDPLPAGWATLDQQTSASFDAGTMRPGASREFRVQVRASRPGQFENRARVTSAEGVEAEAIASTIVRAPALALQCEAQTQAYLGRPVRVCLSLRNTGDAIEPRATVVLPIPAGASVVNTADGGAVSSTAVTWELTNLAPNSIRQVCAELSLPQPGELSLAPEATGSCAARVQSVCEARVVGVPGILVELVDLEDPVEVGNQVHYDIRVLNQGSEPVTNLRLTCTLPDSEEFVSGPVATAVPPEGKTVALELVPVLEPKAQATWQVVVKALRIDDARFHVEVQSDQFDRPILEVESTTLY